VVEIDPWANPKKDEAWLEARRRRAVNEVAFKREYLRDWTSAGGQPFYPEFMSRPERYIRRAIGLIEGQPIVRGWDFGYRRPACVWFQYSPQSGRVWVLRELLGQNIDTHSFRDLVLYLSGERTMDYLLKRPMAVQWVNGILANPKMPPPPWFEAVGAPVQYLDYAGPEALQRRAAVEGESAARVDMDILAEEGIRLGVYHVSVKAREKIIRRLMGIKPDGHPGIIVDPSCKDLCLGLGGRIVFKRATTDDPMPDGPQKDGYYDNLHEALGYGLCNVVPVTEEREPEPTGYRWEGREKVPLPTGEGIPCYEAVYGERW
jgi:hypothetical protein